MVRVRHVGKDRLRLRERASNTLAAGAGDFLSPARTIRSASNCTWFHLIPPNSTWLHFPAPGGGATRHPNPPVFRFFDVFSGMKITGSSQGGSERSFNPDGIGSISPGLARFREG